MSDMQRIDGNNLAITKRYDNLKGAHRQWRHPGHCSQAHGENWSVEIEIRCNVLDDQNFVVDFGKLRAIRDYLDDLFDHTMLIDMDDPERSIFGELHARKIIRLQMVPSASAEGLARKILIDATEILTRDTQNLLRGVWVQSVTVFEDSKNTAKASV